MKEAFNVGLDLAPDDPELLAKQPFRALNAWPNLPGFRETMLAYFDACSSLGAEASTAPSPATSALTLDFFADKFDRPMATLRLLRYPAAAGHAGTEIGAGVHTDYGNITLLATDDVGGLQVQAPRRALDRGAADAGRLCRQYRRLPDALDQRRLRLDAAPRRQRAAFASAIRSPSSSTRTPTRWSPPSRPA